MSTAILPAILAILIWAASVAAHAQAPAADPWSPVRFLLGRWSGEATGQAGNGTVERQYEFVLGERFIRETNTSRYPAQEKNPKGEVHEHVSFLSYDRARKALVLRQFHKEGFVNQYVHVPAAGAATRVIFESERFENFSNDWRARETYDVLGPGEFEETFELAPPGKPFQLYSRNRLRRVSP